MKIAGKYATGYTPDIFPDQETMHRLATQVGNHELRSALLDFQYPFKLEDLQKSFYSPETKDAILKAIQRGTVS